VVADHPQQLSGLLGGPHGGGVGGDAEDVHPAGADFHDEQRVEALERDRVHVEEVRGQKPAGLSFEKVWPLAASPVSLRWRPDTDAAQDPAHRGRADLVSEAAQLALYAAESPAGVLGADTSERPGQRW
jgi:hypothetical protein